MGAALDSLLSKYRKPLPISEELLSIYQDSTYFTRKQILRLYARFQEMNPVLIAANNGVSLELRVKFAKITEMPEMKENPFANRILKVFSTTLSTGDMNFEDFLEMFSSFSDTAPGDIRAVRAFKIYDFDGDGFLGRFDISAVVKTITRNTLTDDQLTFICDKIFEETDQDDDERISYTEFADVVLNSPDFMRTFCIRVT